LFIFDKSMKLKKYIAELKRRNVFKSAITYLIAAWLILQVVSTVIPLFDASERNVLKILLIILSVGFPFWIAFSWVYDITSEGILKTDVKDIDQQSQRSIFDNCLVSAESELLKGEICAFRYKSR
jgi:adenylate cyclase